VCVTYSIRNHIRTLRSLQRVAGTNAYVMDYYVNYHLDEMESRGVDVDHLEDSFIRTLFPDLIAAVGVRLKGAFVSRRVQIMPNGEHHCSSVALRTQQGKVIFGRNFDWHHDACLIVRVHDGDSVSSVAVIDLAYLNLDLADLESTNLIRRIPLLFAPYYVMDGMNRYGVAVSDLSVDGVRAPYDPAKPSLLNSTAMRIILDRAKTVDDAIAILGRYNIRFGETTCHLMFADASGASTVVEFIDG
jgi:choloylglycine hydrolase